MSEAAVKVVGFLLRTAIGVLIVLELVLALGILLQAMDANPDASFTDWAYRNQDRVMRPFDGMFDDVSLGDGSDAVFDVSGIFAMAAYGCLFIPLGLALSRVGRRLDDFDVERQEAAETARQARLFGKEPPPEPEPRGEDEDDLPRPAARPLLVVGLTARRPPAPRGTGRRRYDGVRPPIDRLSCRVVGSGSRPSSARPRRQRSRIARALVRSPDPR